MASAINDDFVEHQMANICGSPTPMPEVKKCIGKNKSSKKSITATATATATALSGEPAKNVARKSDVFNVDDELVFRI